MRYLLNSAVITKPGLYRYATCDAAAAKEWYADGGAESAIGYAETAAALSLLLNAAIPVQRVQIAMQPGDEALVFRLVFPPGTPRIDPWDKGRLGELLEAGHWELGFLVRIE